MAEIPIAFVLMPFDSAFDEIYSLFIYQTLGEAGFEVLRADDVQSQQSILKDIIDLISRSDLVVADLSTNNANVFYELGIAHTLGKKVILLAQEIDKVPFDLRSYRIVIYNTHFASIKKARAELLELAVGAWKNTTPFGNPISDYLSLDNRSMADFIRVNRSQAELLYNDERGFLDYLADFEDATQELEGIVLGLGDDLQAMSAQLERTTIDVNAAKANPSSGTATYIRKLAQRAAKDISTFTSKLSEANQKYTGTLSQFEDGLEYTLSGKVEVPETDSSQLTELTNVLDSLYTQVRQARETFADLKTTIEGLYGIERHLTRAARGASGEMHIFIEGLDQTVAIANRAKIMAKGQLDS